MSRMIIAAALAVGLAWPSAARAQDWPSRPVTIVVAYAAGGPVDSIARIFAARLSEVDYMCEQISTAFPQIESGSVKAVAMMGPDRVSVLPDLPSAKEGGLADFDCGAWAALVLPLKTPDAIVRKLNKAASETIDSAVVRERFAAVGVTIVPPERRSPEYLAKYIPSEIEKWAGPIKASGVSGE